jgi:hypothetical protein
MPTARAFAGEATAEFPQLLASIGAIDPINALIDRVRPLVTRSVDTLQVAAALEASGITDRVARVQFGYSDVFELADVVSQRIGPPAAPLPDRPPQPQPVDGRDISHGALYLIPAAIVPPAMAAVGSGASVLAIVLTAAIGWVLSGATAWLAYRLLGDHQPGSASQMLRLSALSALPLAAVTAGIVCVVTGAALESALLAIAAMAFQMAATILVVYKREKWLYATMAPAVAASILYLLYRPILPITVATGLAAAACVYGIALWVTSGRGAAEIAPLDALRKHRRPLWMVTAFTALSAVFFLYPQLPHLAANRVDIVLALLPVIAGMGVVEWRARRFPEDARALLYTVNHPRQFAARIWAPVLSGLGVCVAVVGGLAAALLAALAVTGRLTAAGAVMAVAGVVLVYALYLGFLLANLGQHRRLCASLLVGLAIYQTVALVTTDALGDTLAFLIAAVALAMFYLNALANCVGEARHHR